MGFESFQPNTVEAGAGEREWSKLVSDWQANEQMIFSEVATADRGEGMRKEWLEKAKKTICMVLMSLTAMAAASEARAGGFSGEYVPDPQVVGREYKIPGALEEGAVSGALEEGVVPGAIRDDGDVYTEKKAGAPEESVRRKKPQDNIKNFERGDSREVENKAINIPR